MKLMNFSTYKFEFLVRKSLANEQKTSAANEFELVGTCGECWLILLELQ